MGTRRLRFLPFSSHSQNLCKSCSPNHIFSRSPSAHGDLEVAGRVKKGAQNRPTSAPRIRCRAPNCPRTVGGLVLATPDELGHDNMIEIKLRSRSTTSETRGTCDSNEQRSKSATPRSATMTTAPSQTDPPSDLTYCAPGVGTLLGIGSPSTVRIRSAKSRHLAKANVEIGPRSTAKKCRPKIRVAHGRPNFCFQKKRRFLTWFHSVNR